MQPAAPESRKSAEPEPLYYFGEDGHPSRPWEPAEIVGIKHLDGSKEPNVHLQLRYPDGVIHLLLKDAVEPHSILTLDGLRRRLKGINGDIRLLSRRAKALKGLLGFDVEPD